jgi:hypothetical protein
MGPYSRELARAATHNNNQPASGTTQPWQRHLLAIFHQWIHNQKWPPTIETRGAQCIRPPHYAFDRQRQYNLLLAHCRESCTRCENWSRSRRQADPTPIRTRTASNKHGWRLIRSHTALLAMIPTKKQQYFWCVTFAFVATAALS